MDKANDETLRSFNRLKGLKDNMPSTVKKTYVSEFHDIITRLERSSKVKLDEFKIPDFEVKPHNLGKDREGNRRFSEESYCDKEFILLKLDALLYYLTNLYSGLNV